MNKKNKKEKEENESMAQFTVRLPKKDLKALRKASEEHRMIYPTTSHLIRVFIDRGLKWLKTQDK